MALELNIDGLIQKLQSRPMSPVERFFRRDLPKHLGTCEIREPQIAMAKLVAQALAEKRHLIAEAGTGTGKSLAYLIPAIYHVKENGGRVVVSTGTIALQEQLVKKDIPLLQDVLDVRFTAALAKGKGNYLCPLRLEEEIRQGSILVDDNEEMERIAAWAEETETGDRADLNFEPAAATWSRVCADDGCLGKKCRQLSRCFYFKAKRRLEEADIIVCNHHLFFLDLAVAADSGGFASVLPEYQAVVFDEAHHIEDIARKALGTEVSNVRLPMLLSRLRRYPEADWERIERARAANDRFFVALTEIARQKGDRFVLDNDAALHRAGMELIDAARDAGSSFGPDVDDKALVLLDQLDRYIRDLRYILDADSRNEVVFWAEVTQGAKLRATLHATPVDVARILRPELFNTGTPCILTSATLSTAGSFNYLKRSVGIPVMPSGDCLEIQVESPFNYYDQCLLYLPQGLPDPKAADFHERVTPFIEQILLKTDGRAFVLFTSYKGMNEVYGRLASRLRWTVLKQGDAPKQQLLERFRADVHSVLFATASFWEGVDVQGESLSCVVLVKLPFAVPDDPVTEAKVRAIERAGGRAFTEYTVPEAIIRLKQGFGRLIRTRQDRGIVAILDPRVKQKGYGQLFLRSLPKCREISSLENVDLFLKGGRQ